MKRILSAVLVLMLCLTSLLPTYAVTPPDTAKAVFTFGNVTGNIGDNISIQVTLKSTEAINTIALSGFTYDSEALTFTGFSYYEEISSLAAITPTFDETNKAVVVGLRAATEYDGNVCKINFTINKAGTHTITATALAKNNSINVEAFVVPSTVEIAKKELTISGINVENKTYDGTTDATITGGTLNGADNGDDVSISGIITGSFASKDSGNNISVNIDSITLQGADKDKYILTQPTGLKANISPRPITVTARNYTIKKNNSVPTPEYDITSGSLVSGDTITGSLAVSANGSVLGEFDITQGTLTAGSNYNITFVKGKLAVVDKTPQNIVVSAIGEKTYGDASFVVSVTPDVTANLSAFTYSSSNTDVAEIATDRTITIKAAGTTNITVNEPGNNEYAAFTSTQELVVNKKPVSVTSIDLDAKTAVLEGILVADTLVELDFDKLNLTITGVVDATTSNVTVTDFELKGEKSENYTVSTNSLDATIATDNTVDITITATNGTATGAGTYLKGNNVTVTATANSGYRFSGWYVGDTSVSTNATYTFVADSDKALEAKFSRISTGGGGTSYYTVKFDTNGGSTIKNLSVKRNGIATEPETPVKDGYTFVGWYTDKELTTAYDFTAKVTKSFTLYAKWTEVDVTKNQIILTIGDKKAKVFGENKVNDVAPKIVNERTMLPARFVAESLGATVTWTEDEPNKVLISKDDVEIIIYIGSDIAYVNGKDVKLDSPAFIENDRTYTPIRFISEELGATVEWHPETQQVVITKK